MVIDPPSIPPLIMFPDPSLTVRLDGSIFITADNISHLKSNGFKKVALVSQLMNSEDPKEDAIMILKELSHEN